MDITRPGAQKILIYFAFSVFFLLPGRKVLNILYALVVTTTVCHMELMKRSIIFFFDLPNIAEELPAFQPSMQGMG